MHVANRNLALFTTACLLLGCRLAEAQSYPSRPIKVVVPWAAGTSVDIVTRVVTNAISPKLGGAFVVENKPGAVGEIGADSVAASPADGYTLLNVATTWIMGKALQGKPFDVKSEWIPIGKMASSTTMLAVSQKVMPGVKDITSLIAFAKANPTMTINYGSAGSGSSTHLAMFVLSKRLGLNATHIPYKGQPLAVTDFVAGRLSAMVMDYGLGKPYIATGTLVPLMMVMSRRIADLPNVPAAREVGLQELEAMIVTHGMVALRGTPIAITTRLSDLVRDALADREVQEGIRKTGSDPEFMDAASYGASLDDVYGKFLKIVQENNIKAD